MAEKTHRFWKAQPPVRDNVKAAGICLQGNNLVLIQASTAVHENQQLAISGHRSFIQHRYVFIPIDSLAALQGRTFKLLYWIFNQQIPIQYEFNPNLAPLEIPLLEQQISTEFKQQEITKIQNYFSTSNSQIPWLLEAENALINNKRLLITPDEIIKPENFLEISLLLLPAICRSRVSVAVGTLNEQQCDWANVIIKSNNSYQYGLVENLIWLNKEIKKNQPLLSDSSQKSGYISLIYSIVNKSGKISQLIEKLDSINQQEINLQNLTAPQIIVSLIPLLSKEQQYSIRAEYLSNLSTEVWKKYYSYNYR